MDTDKEKILAAIKAQRWFFFENNDKILFDRDTALIWANLNHFPYVDNGNFYPPERGYSAVKNLIRDTNSRKFGGFSDWRIPNPNELWRLIEDKTFPFQQQQGNERRIKNKYWWCVDYNGKFAAKDLDSYSSLSIGIDYDTFTCVIPCSSALVPKSFTGTSLNVLRIFKGNNLIPIFNDKSITELYKKFFLDEEPKKPSKPVTALQIKSTKKLDFKPLLAKYDVAELAASPIKYFDAVSEVADAFLEALRIYETEQSMTIGAFSQAALKLDAKYTKNPHLSDAENSLLEKRQQILARYLEAGTDEVKTQILLLKEQAKRFSDRLDEVSRSKDSVRELAALEAEPRASFAFLVENIARIIQTAQKKLDFFILHKNFVAFVVEACTAWSDDYKVFKTSLREKLFNLCRENNIDKDFFYAWYDDWNSKRLLIEQRVLPLIEFALNGHLLSQEKNTAAENALKALQNYRDAVDKFYLNKRKDIYRKFASKSGGDGLEKCETENELYKLAANFQHDLQGIIFACNKFDERIFLLKWSEPLINLSVDAIQGVRGSISSEVLLINNEREQDDSRAHSDDACAFNP